MSIYEYICPNCKYKTNNIPNQKAGRFVCCKCNAGMKKIRKAEYRLNTRNEINILERFLRR